jgi:hypothetical protein
VAQHLCVEKEDVLEDISEVRRSQRSQRSAAAEGYALCLVA